MTMWAGKVSLYRVATPHGLEGSKGELRRGSLTRALRGKVSLCGVASTLPRSRNGELLRGSLAGAAPDAKVSFHRAASP